MHVKHEQMKLNKLNMHTGIQHSVSCMHDAGYACIFQGHMMPGSCMHMQRRFVHAYACMHMQRRVCTHIACLLQFRTVYDMMLNRE